MRVRDNGQANRQTWQAAALSRLLLSSAVAGFGLTAAIPDALQAQALEARRQFDIPAQSLASALNAFGRQSGLQVSLAAAAARGVSAPSVQGSYTPSQALGLLLAGSGIPFQITADKTALIGATTPAAAEPAPEGAILLDTLALSRAAGIGVPFTSPDGVSVVTGESIERFRGSSPADMLRATPGVMSGDARNGAALDVNIRGQQGLGRVDVKVDGAMNALTVYQGYQGISNRSYIDPDFLADVTVNKGPAIDSFGVAGSVEMRTIGVDEVVPAGKAIGLRLRGGAFGNTSTPQLGSRSGYTYPARNQPTQFAVASPTGMDRAGPLQMTDGAASAVLGFRTGAIEGVIGYAWRAQGNYHAGSRGEHANPVALGQTDICTPNVIDPTRLTCVTWPNYIANTGISSYRAGEEVLNTEIETRSRLAKLDWRIAPDQKLAFSYMHVASAQGDRFASQFTGYDKRVQAVQNSTSLTNLKTASLKYTWDPVDNDLIEVSATLWGSLLEQRHPRRNSASIPALPGVPTDFRTGLDAQNYGIDLTNRSRLTTAFGALTLDYGLSFRRESTEPSELTVYFERQWSPRNGVREESAAYLRGNLDFSDRWSASAGVRYQHFWAWDRTDNAQVALTDPSGTNGAGYRTSAGGLGGALGVVFTPVAGTQFYANYSVGRRMPSLTEATTGFFTAINPNLRPETAHNIELGMNHIREGLFAADDRAMVKLSFFHTETRNYLARLPTQLIGAGGFAYTGLQMHNIHAVKTSGLELTGHYSRGGFSADLGATLYTDLRYCQVAGACKAESIYGDYATNQVPPKYDLSLTLSQRVLDDRLTLGGRVSLVGSRMVPHEGMNSRGAQSYISQVGWKPYKTLDLFGSYAITDRARIDLSLENVTDAFYIDALSQVANPAPGRTLRVNFTTNF